MKVIQEKKIEGCLEGNNVWDLLLDDVITKEIIFYLGKKGKLLYIDSFEKPYFRIIVRSKYTVKGTQSNKSIRVFLPDNQNINLLDDLKSYIAEYSI
ncbi:MAG: hypothetical protein HW421_2874 [Ignavibacteria bacterium]|nr:hypothetical protein [Ignavibacteria bacterium]